MYVLCHKGYSHLYSLKTDSVLLKQKCAFNLYRNYFKPEDMILKVCFIKLYIVSNYFEKHILLSLPPPRGE